MVIDKLCPVCGYEMQEGPRDYNICPSCGTEFGLHDLNSTVEDLRDVWMATGPRWYSRVIPEPEDWNPLQQLLNVLLIPQTAQVFGGTFATAAYGGVELQTRPKRVKKGIFFSRNYKTSSALFSIPKIPNAIPTLP
jgi:hypothetical protein